MKGRMKINVAAVLLAVVMMFLMPFKIYAANILSLEDVKSDCIKHMGNITLSDFYYKFIDVSNLSGSYVQFMFISQDVADSNKNLLIYKYYYTDAYQLRFAKFENGEVADINSDKTRFGISYTSDGTWYNCLGNSGSVVVDQSTFEKYFNSEIETNLPYFDSKESAENYFNTGDTSGLLNGDNFSSYDPDIEVPQDLAVNFTAANFLDTSSSNKYGRFDYADSDVIFTWNQSEDIDISNYKTEIYTQLTVQWANTPFNPFSPNWHEQLASKQLVNTVDTLRSNSYTMSKSTFKDIVQKSGDEVIDGGIMGGSVSYIKEPMYFYLRNVVGNSYSDWVRVKITRDTVTTEGIPAFGNGSGTVTSGYDQIKGDSSVGGGNGQAITGDTSGGSYGKNYSVEFDSASMSGIIGFIKNGFGLLGDDGLIALFKETFSFLPAPVWTCIIAMIAASCIVVIWKVVH